AAAALLSGFAPIGFSIAIVFLFAGPHNWFEARYFLSRMPPRWGRLWPFFALGLGGTVALAGFYMLLPIVGRELNLSIVDYTRATAGWNSAVLLWTATLVHMRGRERAERDWSFIWPLALLAIAAAWMWPNGWDLLLVYLHPLLSLVFLYRVVARKRPRWVPALRLCLALVPLAIAVLYLRLADAPPLPGRDALALRITLHAGSDIISAVSPRFLVSLHTFLQMLHYAVWIVAIPLAIRAAPWKVRTVPLAQRGPRWRRAVVWFIVIGAAACVALWLGFAANYPVTRDLYFTLAMLHVLAEVPFLLRTL
ncbi:MAG: hypothetical protein KC503_41450, partial [Myxococcales bacterium]|nr:hypothetical protein [Myxococcales bacterium]